MRKYISTITVRRNKFHHIPPCNMWGEKVEWFIWKLGHLFMFENFEYPAKIPSKKSENNIYLKIRWINSTEYSCFPVENDFRLYLDVFHQNKTDPDSEPRISQDQKCPVYWKWTAQRYSRISRDQKCPVYWK